MAKVFRTLGVIVICALAIISISANRAMTVPPPVAALPNLVFTTVVSGLTDPLFVTNAGDARLFIVDQDGHIKIYKNGSLNGTDFLDISTLSDFISEAGGGEQGLLGLAFDPNYATNGNFYITYTTDDDTTCPYVPTSGDDCPFATTLARYHVSADPDVADSSSGTVLLSVPKRFDNHNGGMLAFGPDGYLYMSVGDGGSGGDPDGNGQSLDTLSAKLLRLDVDGTPDAPKQYAIPHSNPFYGSSDPNVQQEIWAYGLRNPWRFSFDSSTGDLFIGDVGQDVEEEVDYQSHLSTGGENYGWNCREGNRVYNSGCSSIPNYVPPIVAYDHGKNDSYGCALIGGYVYRGSQFPSMQGYYFYGDLCSGKVFGMIQNSRKVWTSTLLASTGYYITSFGQDDQGELYLTDGGGGQVIKISNNTADVTRTLTSQGSFDGFVLETSPGSGVGGTINSNGKWFSIGDTADNRQTRAILSFQTASLPAHAVIDGATIRIRLDKISSPDPFSALGNLSADMTVPNFGANPALEAADFQASATQPGVATFNSVPTAGWYSAPISSGALSAINLSGNTQFRLAFDTPSNDDNTANYASFFSGNYGMSSRPQLVIQYHVP
ncbi:MAG TPA: PQQ-dependent sugar dehydrogenase [Anaerolineales bacterium]|nr:PQQ-dependent sugar dehydrogenase [Anaerolineales bacterium]